jgi:hypothetical protein
MDIMNSLDVGQCETKAVYNTAPPVLKLLQEKKQRLEQQLDTVNRAIESLEANPAFVACFDAVTKAARY